MVSARPPSSWLSVLCLLAAPIAGAAEECPAKRGPTGVPKGISEEGLPEVKSCRELAATHSLKLLNFKGDDQGEETKAEDDKRPAAEKRRDEERKRENRKLREDLLKRSLSVINDGVPGSVVGELTAVEQANIDPEQAGISGAEKQRRMRFLNCEPRCPVVVGQELGLEFVGDGRLSESPAGYRLAVNLWSMKKIGGSVSGIEVKGRTYQELVADLERNAWRLYDPLQQLVQQEYKDADAARTAAIEQRKDDYRKDNGKRSVTRGTGWIVLGAGGGVLALSAVGVYFGLDKSHDIQNGRLQSVQEMLEASANVRTINTATRIVAGIGAAVMLTGLGLVVFNLDRTQPWMSEPPGKGKGATLQLAPTPGGLVAWGSF